MNDWKPGDVAMVTYDLYEDGENIVSEPRVLRSGNRWYGSNGWVLNDDTLTIRPLVVIDPEDREAVERLAQGYRESFWGDDVSVTQGHVVALQAALREFAAPKPPKPEEPMGLGAVVEDEDGLRWMRWWVKGEHPSSNRPWQCADGMGSDRRWSDITAVRVLSEGVQP